MTLSTANSVSLQNTIYTNNSAAGEICLTGDIIGTAISTQNANAKARINGGPIQTFQGVVFTVGNDSHFALWHDDSADEDNDPQMLPSMVALYIEGESQPFANTSNVIVLEA